MSTNRLSGKVAVVTGSGRGQGRDVALRFAAEGASVVGCDLNAAAAEVTVRLAEDAGGRMISVHPLDLSEEIGAQRLIEAAVDAYGGVDVLYNNAMASRRGTAQSTSYDDFMFTLRNTVVLNWLTIKSAIPVFKERGGGSVINVTSIGALEGGTGMVGNLPITFPYAVAKGALLRMTTHMAITLAEHGIRVNNLSPGAIETPLTETLFGEEGDLRHAAHLGHMLIRRFGTGQDIASGAVYLASDESSYVTGQNLIIDGGWHASGGVGQPKKEIMDELAEATVKK